MRPVNLIPPDQRRGEQAPLRTGALVYLVVGAFIAGLVGVTSLVLINNKIADSKAEVVELKREDAAAMRKAEELSSYVKFNEMSRQRVETVVSLADSRFDWERVMNEFALVLPHDVWLTKMTATAAPGVNVEGGGAGDLREEVKGPALHLKGCSTGQPAVAGFVTVLKDIDGVTRVGVESSEVAGEDGGTGSPTEGQSDDCRTRSFITQFEIIVAFDAAPAPATSSDEAAVTATAPEQAESTAKESSKEG